MPRNRGIVQSSKEEHRNKVRAEKQKQEMSEKQSPYQRFQMSVFMFLDRPSNKVAYCYHIVNLSLILGSIIISVCSTVEYFSESMVFTHFILYYEVFLLSWFTLEYFFRVWSCVTTSKWEGWRGRFRFMRSFYMCVDAFVIGTTLTTILLQVKHSYFTMLRITRFLQVFRVLRLDRQRGDLRTMGQVVYKHKKELVTCYFVGFIILFGGTYVIYIVEKGTENPTIDNMANGIYWAMITVTSVGYGDISPNTWAGKICTGIFALVGCAFFALPAGILGSGFALQVAKQKKEQRYTKIKNPAAIVIQNLWRNHAVKRSRYQLQGTWAYMFPQVMQHISRNGYYGLLPGVKAIHDSSSFDLFRASLGRKKTRETNRAELKLLARRSKKRSTTSSTSTTTGSQFSPKKKKSSIVSFGSQRSQRSPDEESDREMLTKSRNSITNTPQSQRKRTKDKLPLSELISGRYKAAIRFVLRVKYFTDVRKFKKERYPFVNVQDIMEKNSHNHLETLSYLKDIKKYIEEFQVELEEMKVAFRDYQIMFNTSPLTTSQGLTYNNNNNNNNNNRVEEVEDGEVVEVGVEDIVVGGLCRDDDDDDDVVVKKDCVQTVEQPTEGEILINGVVLFNTEQPCDDDDVNFDMTSHDHGGSRNSMRDLHEDDDNDAVAFERIIPTEDETKGLLSHTDDDKRKLLPEDKELLPHVIGLTVLNNHSHGPSAPEDAIFMDINL